MLEARQRPAIGDDVESYAEDRHENHHRGDKADDPRSISGREEVAQSRDEREEDGESVPPNRPKDEPPRGLADDVAFIDDLGAVFHLAGIIASAWASWLSFRGQRSALLPSPRTEGPAVLPRRRSSSVECGGLDNRCG